MRHAFKLLLVLACLAGFDAAIGNIAADAQSVRWQPIENFPDSNVFSILFTRNRTLVVTTGPTFGRLYRSTDLGSSWSEVAHTGLLLETANGDLIVWRRSLYWRSTDGGET